MAINSEIVRKLTDYILLNAYSLNSSGLAKGKAGHALCLFEISRYLNDKNYEDHAFELLQEALVSQTDRIGFSSGLSGIGYTLLYLIRYEFVTADFTDLFGKQLQKIYFRIQKETDKSLFIDLLPFFIECVINNISVQKSKAFIESILNDCIVSASKKLTKEQWHKETRKSARIFFLTMLFRSVFLLRLQNIHVSYNCIGLGQIVSELAVLNQTGRLSLPYDLKFYMYETKYLRDFKTDCSLQIDSVTNATADLNSLTRFGIIESYLQQDLYLARHFLNEITDENIEQVLTSRMSRTHSICSFHYGIIRFLLYYLCMELRMQNNSSRFINLLV